MAQSDGVQPATAIATVIMRGGLGRLRGLLVLQPPKVLKACRVGRHYQEYQESQARMCTNTFQIQQIFGSNVNDGLKLQNMRSLFQIRSVTGSCDNMVEHSKV
jgi:hypothetical protein